MTIQEAIRQRIERFNRLWVKAVGYSFEDEAEILKKEHDNAVNKANERAKEIGYSDYQEYIEKLNSFYKYDETMGYQLSDEVSYNKAKDNVLDELIKNIPTVSPLYLYEMSVLNEVEKIINFLYTKNDDLKKAWEKYLTNENTTWNEIGKEMEKDGYEFGKGHSGNSYAQSLSLAHVFVSDPDLFQYVHGSLAALVGDEGYHDDRSDVKEFLEKRKYKEKKNKNNES